MPKGKMRPGRKRWSKAKFDRCVSKVKGTGAKSPYAVCMASMQGTTKRKRKKKKKRR